MFAAGTAWRVGLTNHEHPTSHVLWSQHPMKLLHDTKVAELIPRGQLVVSIPLGSSIEQLFNTLAENKIISAPVFKQSTRALVGMVEMLDVVALLDKLTGERTSPETLFSLKVDDAMRFTASLVPALDGVPRHPILYLPSSDSVAVLFERLTQCHERRILVLSSDKTSHTEEEQVLGIITQRDVVSWVVKNIRSFEHSCVRFSVRKSLRELGFGPHGHLHREPEIIRDDCTALQAFLTLREKNLSMLPVVNPNGRVSGAVSASDLRALRADNIVAQMSTPLAVFLHGHPSPMTLPLTATLEQLLDMLNSSVQQRIHRVILVNDRHEPLAVVSITDVLPLFA